MRTRTTTWSITILVSLAGWTQAQEAQNPGNTEATTSVADSNTDAAKDELPESLSVLVAMGLRSNPDVLIAEARLKEAEATLNQVRLRVTQEIVTTHQELQFAEKRLARLNRLVNSNARSKNEDTVLDRREQVRLAAQLRYLVGLAASQTPSTSQPAPMIEQGGLDRHRPQPVPDHIRAKLNATVKCDFADTPLTEVVQELQKHAKVAFIPGPDLRDTRGMGGMGGMGATIPRVSLSLGNVPIYTAMMAIADLSGYWFVIRDYGVLVTSENRARKMDAPTIPAVTSQATFGGGGGVF